MEDKYKELNAKFPGGLAESNWVDTDYPDGNVHWMRFAGAQCPICGHTDWCCVNVTGTKIVCMRKDDGKAPEIGDGGHLYVLKGTKAVDFDSSKVKATETVPYASDKIRDLLYRMVLVANPLAAHHRANLKKRGLTDEEINLHRSRGFGSIYDDRNLAKKYGVKPFAAIKLVKGTDGKGKIISQWRKLFAKLNLPDNVWQGVPGFYLKQMKVDKPLALQSGDGKFTIEPGSYDYPMFTANTDGMLIPYYDEENQIVGFQTRVDHRSVYAEITKKPQGANIHVYFDKDTNHYRIVLYDKFNKDGKTLAESDIHGDNPVHINYGINNSQEIVFKPKFGGKYFWVSSSKEYLGASGKTPIQVSYNPKIASLAPHDKALEDYIKQPKAVWLTEGGLKALVATAKLSSYFSEEQLDDYGHDFLAVAGVGSYRKFIPMLEKLHVNRITVAFDMDFINNDQVADHYRHLINLLHEKGYQIRMALWDPKKAKGIDDALVNGSEIRFKEI